MLLRPSCRYLVTWHGTFWAARRANRSIKHTCFLHSPYLQVLVRVLGIEVPAPDRPSGIDRASRREKVSNRQLDGNSETCTDDIADSLAQILYKYVYIRVHTSTTNSTCSSTGVRKYLTSALVLVCICESGTISDSQILQGSKMFKEHPRYGHFLNKTVPSVWQTTNCFFCLSCPEILIRHCCCTSAERLHHLVSSLPCMQVTNVSCTRVFHVD